MGGRAIVVRASQQYPLRPVILLNASDLTMRRPERPLFDHLSFTVSRGDRLGVVGINGCGKSTLLRVLAGTMPPEGGGVLRSKGVRLGFLDQDPAVPPGTVRTSAGGGWEVEAVLDRLGMTPMLEADTASLSGGQRKRVALARVLVDETDVLILDEPTNHLDIDAIAWLEEHLAGYRGALVLVTHDRHVLDSVCTKVLELDRGTGYVHAGGYEAYLDGRATRESQAESAESTRRILAKQELAWLRRGAPARTRKPKARIESAKAIVEARPDGPARSGSLDLAGAAGGSTGKGGAGWGSFGVIKRHPATPRLGGKVVELHGVGHAWADGPMLFDGIDLLLDNRERLGVVGPNGGGKSTLLDIMAGRITPTTGAVTQGPTVELAYYDQLGAGLDPSLRVREAVAGPHRQPDWYDAALLEQFWFDGDAQFAPIGLLSGGERRRLQLLLALASRPNVLLLDEPTNDLDLDTLRTLEEFLDDWPGALVVVSHDRAFLERTVTDAIVIDGLIGTVGDRHPGGYPAWEQQRRARRTKGRTGVVGGVPALVAAADAASPSRPDGGPTDPRPPSHAPERATPTRSPSTLRNLAKESEKEMAKLQRRQDQLAADLQSAGGDHVALERVGAELAACGSDLAAAEERWLELSDELDIALLARQAGR